MICFLVGPCSCIERPLSAARKVQEERDAEETAAGVFQALQRENSPLQIHRQERSTAQNTPVELHLHQHISYSTPLSNALSYSYINNR